MSGDVRQYMRQVYKCHKLADRGRSCLAVYHAPHISLVIALKHEHIHCQIIEYNGLVSL